MSRAKHFGRVVALRVDDDLYRKICRIAALRNYAPGVFLRGLVSRALADPEQNGGRR